MRGEDLPIKWIGRNTFRRSGASWPKSVVPIRVSRFAIDDHAPHTDLYLSPGHALFIGGFLMEVRDLVNGTSIAPAAPPDMETIEYFQIVLNTQEVIWAEGAPVETFGGGNLDVFTNFVEYKRLYPNDPCLAIPLVSPNLSKGERTCTLCSGSERHTSSMCVILFKRLMSSSQRVPRNSPHNQHPNFKWISSRGNPICAGGCRGIRHPQFYAQNCDGDCNQQGNNQRNTRGAPGPIAGTGLPVLAVGYGVCWLIKRGRRKVE